jgi:hypothetical protein
VGLVPPVVSAVPKTAIAYSATVFLGVAAEKYYRRHPELQQRLSALVLSLADRRRPVHG